MQDVLIFGEIIRAPDIRTLYDMREVVADREWLEKAENFEAVLYVQGTCTE